VAVQAGEPTMVWDLVVLADVVRILLGRVWLMEVPVKREL
jgi:hypothetical protein